MRPSFIYAMEILLRHEGGFSNHPLDPGGATYRGITFATFQRAVAKRIVAGPATVERLKDLSKGEVSEIYHRLYYQEVFAHRMPPGLDYMVFDAAVNQGPKRAVQFLQRALNSVGISPGPIDGIVGPLTLGAMDRYISPDGLEDLEALQEGYAKYRRVKLTERVALYRLLHYSSIGKAVFQKGWFRRLLECLSEAVRMPDRNWIKEDHNGMG